MGSVVPPNAYSTTDYTASHGKHVSQLERNGAWVGKDREIGVLASGRVLATSGTFLGIPGREFTSLLFPNRSIAVLVNYVFQLGGPSKTFRQAGERARAILLLSMDAIVFKYGTPSACEN